MDTEDAEVELLAGFPLGFEFLLKRLEDFGRFDGREESLGAELEVFGRGEAEAGFGDIFGKGVDHDSEEGLGAGGVGELFVDYNRLIHNFLFF
jgi:hypothetical protein